jgi:hypothetical protein
LLNLITKNKRGIQRMKKLIFSLIFAGCLVLGVSSTKAADFNKEANVEAYQTSSAGYVYVTVYENGKKWTYVYTEDGIYVTKYEDE